MTNNIATYQAEIDYRRELMRRDRDAIRVLRRARKAASPKNHGR